MLTPREKSPILEAQRRVKPVTLDSKPNTLPTELFRPLNDNLLHKYIMAVQ